MVTCVESMDCVWDTRAGAGLGTPGSSVIKGWSHMRGLLVSILPQTLIFKISSFLLSSSTASVMLGSALTVLCISAAILACIHARHD